MTYKLEKDTVPEDRAKDGLGIAIMVLSGGKYVWIGSVYKTLDNNTDFDQNDHFCLDLADIKLVSLVADQVDAEGFEKIYNEAEAQSDPLDEIFNTPSQD